MNPTERLEELESELQETTLQSDFDRLRRVASDLLNILQSLCTENAILETRLASMQTLVGTDGTNSQSNENSKSKSLSILGCSPQQFWSILSGVEYDPFKEASSTKEGAPRTVIGPDRLAADFQSIKEVLHFLRAAVARCGPVANLPWDDQIFVTELISVLDLDRNLRQQILSRTEVPHEPGS